MTETTVPRLPKWPFYIADALLCAAVAFIFSRMGTIDSTGDALLAGGCLVAVALAAWACVTPWLREYDSQAALGETTTLKDTLSQIQDLQAVGRQIQSAGVSWQTAQDSANRIVESCQTISQKMATEAAGFRKFFENVNEQEKAALRLEVEKLRRMEGDWLQAAVRMLDHTHALHGAGLRSENQNLILQLTQFQHHIRDSVRRLGLNAFCPDPQDFFDERTHQPVDASVPPGPDKRIEEVRACGYTYQGQLIRKALVVLENPGAPKALVSEPVARPTPAPAPEPEPEPSAPPVQSDEGSTEPTEAMEDPTGPDPGDIFEPLEPTAEPTAESPTDPTEPQPEAGPATSQENPKPAPRPATETEERQVKLPWGK